MRGMFTKRRAVWGLVLGAAIGVAAPMLPAVGSHSTVTGCSPTHALDVTLTVGEQSSPHTIVQTKPGSALAELGVCLPAG